MSQAKFITTKTLTSFKISLIKNLKKQKVYITYCFHKKNSLQTDNT